MGKLSWMLLPPIVLDGALQASGWGISHQQSTWLWALHTIIATCQGACDHCSNSGETPVDMLHQPSWTFFSLRRCGVSKSSPPTLYSRDRQSQLHLGTCQKCRHQKPCPVLQNQNLFQKDLLGSTLPKIPFRAFPISLSGENNFLKFERSTLKTSGLYCVDL